MKRLPRIALLASFAAALAAPQTALAARETASAQETTATGAVKAERPSTTRAKIIWGE